MTSATSHSNNRQNLRGFTLVEILIVIGIIVVLVAIAIPTIMRAYRQADKTKTAADLQAIGLALEAYKGDFGDYPRFVPGGTAANLDPLTNRGALLLCRALVGPDATAVDGADGPGFRIRPGTPAQGKVYGPYIQTDRLKVINTASPATPGNYELADSNGVAILYFPISPIRSDLTQANAYIGNAPNPAPAPYINFYDNSNSTMFFSNPALFQVMVGEKAATANGQIDPGETAISVPYLLWAAGADGKFGPLSTSSNDVAACDDVTNIPK